MTPQKSYAIYLRRSTSDENHQQYSIPAQEKICIQYAQKHGLRVAEIFREQHSARAAGKRPLFLKMLKDLREGTYAGVIVHNVDRLLRSIGDYALIDDLRNKHAEFHFVDGSYPNTPEGNMMLGINVVFAKWYIDKLGKEVKKGFAESLSQGRLPRGAPAGYLDMGNGIKEPDPLVAPLVKKSFELYATGDYSIESLTAEMSRRGLRTKRGHKYRTALVPSTMHRILSNPFYYGVVKMNGQEHPGRHKPLISKDLFERIRAMMDGKSTSFVTKKPYIFRGMVRCDCGHLLSPYEQKGHVYYGCHNKQCPQSTTRQEKIEDAIAAILERFDFTNEELEHRRLAVKKLEGFVIEERDGNLQSIDERRKKLMADLDKTRKLVIDGRFNKQHFEAESSESMANLK